MESPAYKKGEVILSSKPFACVLDRDNRGKRCDYCFHLNDKLLRCSVCSFAYYCDKSCQRHAWKVHKQECENMKRVKPKEPAETVLLMARIINKLKKEGQATEREQIGPYSRCFEDLQAHCEEIKKDTKRMEHFTSVSLVLSEFLGKSNVPPRDELFKMFGRMVINTFSICNAEMQPIGAGLYLVPSCLDHSCSPNVLPVFEGTTLILRALTDIPSKELKDVFISYVDLLDTTADRRKLLLEQYYFTCCCPRCSVNLYDDEMNKLAANVNSKEAASVVSYVKRAVYQMDQLKKSKGDLQTLLELCRKAYKVAENVLAPSHILRVKVLDHAFDVCITLNLLEEALEYGKQTIEPYCRYYENMHPNLGIQLFRIGKIELCLEQLQKAEKTLLQAEKILVVTHGEKHRLYQDLLQQVCQCQEELRYNGLG